MRQFNIEVDKTSPKTRQFTVPADEHFSILVTEAQTLKIGTANLAKLSEEEKQTATDKGWTLA